ncbi:protein of unknown function [Pararobbsia alpina]
MHFGALPSRFAFDIDGVNIESLALFLFTERIFTA